MPCRGTTSSRGRPRRRGGERRRREGALLRRRRGRGRPLEALRPPGARPVRLRQGPAGVVGRAGARGEQEHQARVRVLFRVFFFFFGRFSLSLSHLSHPPKTNHVLSLSASASPPPQIPPRPLARDNRRGPRHPPPPRQGPLDAEAQFAGGRRPRHDEAAPSPFLRNASSSLPFTGQRGHVPAGRIPLPLRRRPRPRSAAAPEAAERESRVECERRDLRRPREPLLPRGSLRVCRPAVGEGGPCDCGPLGNRAGGQGGRGGAEGECAELPALQGELRSFSFLLPDLSASTSF